MSLRYSVRLVTAIAVLALLFSWIPGNAAAAALSPRGGIAMAPQEHAAAQEPEVHAAQEPEGESHAREMFEEEEHGETPKEWYYWPSKWINFIALVALLYWMLVIPPPAIQEIFSFPGLRAIFVNRASAILAARDLAAEQKDEAVHLLRDSEQRLTRIEEEVAALVADAHSDADREQVRALEDGKAQAGKIAEVAQREITHQRIAAQRQLRGFVADLAVNMAEQSLSEHLTDSDQDRLIREYLARLGQSMA